MTKPVDDALLMGLSPEGWSVQTPFGRLELDRSGFRLVLADGSSLAMPPLPAKVTDGR